jgi:DNA polymerase elongation subunit (family B)
MDVPAARQALNKLAAGPRILVIDIETMAPLVYSFQLRKAFIGLNQIVRQGRVICFAAQWVGDKKVMFHSEHHDAGGHQAMIEAAHRLLTEADVVVHYNGMRFDRRHLNRSFKQAGLAIPASYVNVDLMTALNKVFVTSTGSYKLDAWLMEFDLPRKLDTGGFELWFDCDNGVEKAWRDMRRYNMQDIRSTRALLEDALPWIRFPHAGLFGGKRAGCPRCQSTNVVQEGYVVKMTGKYAQWRCLDCTGLFEGTHRVEAVHHRAI